MDNNPESSDDHENEMDEIYEEEESEDDVSEDAIQLPRPLLTEIISVWISAVSLIFRPKAITFEEEIEFATWRRFWVTLVSGALLNTFVLSLGGVFVNDRLGLPRQSPSIAFDVLWSGLVGFIVYSCLIWVGGYGSYRWIMRQKVDTESDFLEHIHILAIVWLTKQILLMTLSIISTLSAAALIGRSTASQISQGAIDLSVVIGFIIGIVASGSVIIYSYWILAFGMKVNHIGLRGKKLWIVIGIIFLALDPLRILISNVLPKIQLVTWLHNELLKRFLRQS
jgi:hypothetical protein